MKNLIDTMLALSIGLVAATGFLAAPAAAQGGSAATRPSAAPAQAPVADAAGRPAKAGAAASNPDMRLWSFGECDKNFPYTGSSEHKECVRVVGSDEARDARAFHFCDASHAKDPAEAKRCKEAYVENKTRATQEGFRATGANPQPPPAPVAAPPKRDQAEAIASLTRAIKETAETAEEPAAAPAAEVAPPAAPPPVASSTGSNVMLGLALVLVLAGIGMRYLRRLTDAEVAMNANSRKGGGNPRTVTGSNPRTVPRNNPRTVSGLPPRQY